MENQNPFTDLDLHKRTSTAPASTSSNVLIFGSQTGENTSALPSSDITTDYDIVSDDDLSIALCKGKHTCTSHTSHFIFYSHFSLSCLYFIMDPYFVLKFVSEATSISGWKDVMKKEMLALEQNEI